MKYAYEVPSQQNAEIASDNTGRHHLNTDMTSSGKRESRLRGDLYYYLDFVETTKSPRPRLVDKPLCTGGFLASRRVLLSALPLVAVQSGSEKSTDDPTKVSADCPSTVQFSSVEKEVTPVRHSPSIYSQVIPIKKKVVVVKKAIDPEKIRRRCMRDFARSWNAAEVMGGYSERPHVMQLMDEEPIRFWRKDLEHEEFNEKFKHFDEYDRIKREAKAARSKKS